MPNSTTEIAELLAGTGVQVQLGDRNVEIIDVDATGRAIITDESGNRHAVNPGVLHFPDTVPVDAILDAEPAFVDIPEFTPEGDILEFPSPSPAELLAA